MADSTPVKLRGTLLLIVRYEGKVMWSGLDIPAAFWKDNMCDCNCGVMAAKRLLS